MLKIGICTSREKFGKYAESVLKDILCEYKDWMISKVRVQSLLDKKQSEISEYHILCIDEQLLKQQGIAPLSFVGRVRPDATLIILEGIEEKGIVDVRYHLFAYHMQRLKQQSLKCELNRQWQRVNRISRNLDIKIDGDMVSIPIEQIKYIESNNRRIILYTVAGDYEYSEKMYVLEDLLKEDAFIRCHQSYIVSKRFVTDFNSMEIYLDDIVLPIGRKYKQQVQAAMNFEKTIALESEVNKASEKQGVLVCTSGIYQGVTIYFRPEQGILVGRDEKLADVVVDLPKTSRLHCMLVFHEQDNTYEVVDFSKNGTYIFGRQRLVADENYVLKPGTEICFGDLDSVYCLG